jgi:hypothetical protein
MLDVKDIKSLYADEGVVLTDHFMERIRGRDIKIPDVEIIIDNGEIIEQYSDSYPHPSALMLGYVNEDVPIHVVVGIGKGFLWLITAYYPTLEKWEPDYKTRKAEEII